MSTTKRSKSGLAKLQYLSGIITESEASRANGRVIRQLPPQPNGSHYFRIFMARDGIMSKTVEISAQDAKEIVSGNVNQVREMGQGVYELSDGDGDVLVVAANWAAAKQAIEAVFGEFVETITDPANGSSEDEVGSVYYMIISTDSDDERAPVKYKQFKNAARFWKAIDAYGAEETPATPYVYAAPDEDVVFVWGNNKNHAREQFIEAYGEWVETEGMPFYTY